MTPWAPKHRWPAYNGTLEFAMSFEFLGQEVTKKAKVAYEHTRVGALRFAKAGFLPRFGELCIGNRIYRRCVQHTTQVLIYAPFPPSIRQTVV